MDLLTYFEIDGCVSWILDNRFQKVALQFPESLFSHVNNVVQLLQTKLSTVYFVVLADAKYGSCCVDEIACEHAEVNGVIHFGHSCLSNISRPNLKVKYVFGDESFDGKRFDEFLNIRMTSCTSSDHFILFADVVYLKAIETIKSCLSKYSSDIFCAEILLPDMLESFSNYRYNSNSICGDGCQTKCVIAESEKSFNNCTVSHSIDNANIFENTTNQNADFTCKSINDNKVLNVPSDINTAGFNKSLNIICEGKKSLNNDMVMQTENEAINFGSLSANKPIFSDDITGNELITSDNLLRAESKVSKTGADVMVSNTENPIGNSFIKFGRLFELKPLSHLSEYTIFYIGPENQFLSVLMMTFSKCRFIVYDPTNVKPDNMMCSVNKMLMKRYFMIEKARNSRFIGILIGTLNVSYYASIIAKLKRVIKRAGKKCRVYAPGTPNVAKLANVPEFDLFVVVACPTNSLIDSSEYLQPIVTPYELILACTPAFDWTGEYETDFKWLCDLADVNLRSDMTTNHRTDVSLVSGRIINFEDETMPTPLPVESKAGLQLVAQENSIALSQSYLSARTFQGLDPQLGETPVKKFIVGSSGVAVGYSHEATNSKP